MNSRANDKCLLSATRIIAAIESSPLRETVFQDIARRNGLINLIYKTHKALHPTWISSLMIACFGLKSALAFQRNGNSDAPILATYAFANEKRAIALVASCIGNTKVECTAHGLRHMLSAASFVFALDALRNWRKILQCLRIIHRINRRYAFMPACRTAATLNHYLRFRYELQKSPPRAVLVASDYAPDSLGLAWTARRLGIPTIYIAHAFTAPGSLRPPLWFTLSILYGKKMRDYYAAKGSIDGKVVYCGLEGNYRPLMIRNLRQHGMSVGLFLSAPLNISGLKNVITELEKALRPKTIVVRKHPVGIASGDLEPHLREFSTVRITQGSSLEEDAGDCDLAIVGASSAMLQILKYGVPCLYSPHLECSVEDYNGFVAAKLAPGYSSLQSIDINEVIAFYNTPEWPDRFSQYDAYYGRNDDSKAAIKAAIEEIIA